MVEFSPSFFHANPDTEVRFLESQDQDLKLGNPHHRCIQKRLPEKLGNKKHVFFSRVNVAPG